MNRKHALLAEPISPLICGINIDKLKPLNFDEIVALLECFARENQRGIGLKSTFQEATEPKGSAFESNLLDSGILVVRIYFEMLIVIDITWSSATSTARNSPALRVAENSGISITAGSAPRTGFRGGHSLFLQRPKRAVNRQFEKSNLGARQLGHAQKPLRTTSFPRLACSGTELGPMRKR